MLILYVAWGWVSGWVRNCIRCTSVPPPKIIRGVLHRKAGRPQRRTPCCGGPVRPMPTMLSSRCWCWARADRVQIATCLEHVGARSPSLEGAGWWPWAVSGASCASAPFLQRCQRYVGAALSYLGEGARGGGGGGASRLCHFSLAASAAVASAVAAALKPSLLTSSCSISPLAGDARHQERKRVVGVNTRFDANALPAGNDRTPTVAVHSRHGRESARRGREGGKGGGSETAVWAHLCIRHSR